MRIRTNEFVLFCCAQPGWSTRAPSGFIRAMACWLVGAVALVSQVDAAEPDDPRYFREKIEPVLKSACYGCHAGDGKDIKGGLRLDTPAGLRAGGDSGDAVIARESSESLLIQAIRHEGGLEMPPKKPKLSEETIANFVKWIDAGAIDPRDEKPVAENAWIDEARQHWAFQPVKKVDPPQVNKGDWGNSPIDAFILAKLEERQWEPAPRATREELIRRVTFDLIGLPPTPEEIDAFVHDQHPDAYSRLVDRLMASERYGERAAMHWLDVVRYAESEGYEYDRHIPGAWRYRDYVINAFNMDKPFDKFITEQIAGDELDPENAECLTASVFHRLGPVRRNAGNPEIALSRNEVLTERTDIIGAVFLGLTVGCARCHNHKLEPISQKDYYRLQAYLAATEEDNIILASAEEQREWEARTQEVKKKIDALKAKAKDAEELQKEKLSAEIEALEDAMPAPLPTIPATQNARESRTEIHVLKRGVWENKGDLVGPRPLSVLVANELKELSPEVTNPRTQLAEWLASPGHPLTSRVIVNRLWQQHFGVGLVKSANDFGTKGDRPSHPELLDWLASTLVENGWKLKAIHRMIVLSHAYQQSTRSATAAQYVEDDPENRLQWHFPRRRLSAEEVRDAMLAVSGRINLISGGPSVIVPVDPELVNLLYKPSQWAVTQDETEHDRRSIYLMAKRNLRLPFLETLDAPTLSTSCARRLSTTHPPQALELLNGSLSNDLAVSFARRLEKETNSREELVQRAFRLALGRSPTDVEQQKSLAFLQEQPLSEFTLALFNLNGFLYVR